MLSLDPGLDISFDEGALFSATQLSDAVNSAEIVSATLHRDSLSVVSTENEEEPELDGNSEIENVDPESGLHSTFRDNSSGIEDHIAHGSNPARFNQINDDGLDLSLDNRSHIFGTGIGTVCCFHIVILTLGIELDFFCLCYTQH